MFDLVRDFRYRLGCRKLLRRLHAEGACPEAIQVLNDGDLFDTFAEGLAEHPVMAKATGVGDGQPILDAIKAFFAWAWEHREEIIKFILMILSLFPKSPGVVVAAVLFLGLLSLPLSSVFG